MFGFNFRSLDRRTQATKEQDVKYKSKEAAGLEKAVAEHSTDREGASSRCPYDAAQTHPLRDAIFFSQNYHWHRNQSEAKHYDFQIN